MSTEIVRVPRRSLSRIGLEALPPLRRVLHRQHQEQEYANGLHAGAGAVP
jgi:hypothetical protein